ncbi:cation:proton antiporter [candidate division KSB1 bacterium]
METILGIIIIIILSFFGAHKSFTRLPFLGDVTLFFLTGTEFFIVGILLGPLVADMISQKVITGMFSFIGLGLGWLGMLYGLQFEFRKLIRIPRGYIIGAFIQALVTFVFIAVVSALILRFFNVDKTNALAASLMLGAAGSCSSQTALALIAQDKSYKRNPLLRMLRFMASIGDLPGLIVFGFVLCLLQSSPIIPGVSYVFLQWAAVTIVLGVIFGWLMIFILSLSLRKEERFLFAIGIVLFSGGIAAYLKLSPLFINFIAGMITANFCRNHYHLDDIMATVEKPIYLILLVLAGSMWSIGTLYAFLFAILFLFFRIAGKVTGAFIIGRSILKDQEIPAFTGLSLVNQGGMAFAMVIHFQVLYDEVLLSTMITVIVAALLVSELIGQRLAYSVLTKEAVQ